MKALIISLESFQKGEVPEEVKQYIMSQHGNIFTILDESSKIKTNQPCKESKKSKRTQAVMRLNKIGHRCILTGTFMSKTPVNAFDQMNFLKDGFFPESMFAFAEHYEVRRTLPTVRGARILISKKDYDTIKKKLEKCSKDPYMYLGACNSIYRYYGISKADCDAILASKEYTPFKNIDDLWSRIGDTCLKVERKDVTDILPKIYQTRKVELTAEQKKLYMQLQNQHCTDRITVDNGLKLYLRFQDICNGYEPVETEEVVGYDSNGMEKHRVDLIPLKENPKLDMLDEIIDELGNEQVVVWCSRTKLLYDAKARLEAQGYVCGVYDGVNKNREEDYEKFSKKEIQILFANQGSMSYGFDGLKQCDYAVYLSNDYSVEKRVQSEERICRGKVKDNKYIIDISCSGTCEQRITEALKQGKELLDTGITDASLFLLKEE